MFRSYVSVFAILAADGRGISDRSRVFGLKLLVNVHQAAVQVK